MAVSCTGVEPAGSSLVPPAAAAALEPPQTPSADHSATLAGSWAVGEMHSLSVRERHLRCHAISDATSTLGLTQCWRQNPMPAHAGQVFFCLSYTVKPPTLDSYQMTLKHFINSMVLFIHIKFVILRQGLM